MPGPGHHLIGEEEKRELLEVIEAGHLFRYGNPENPHFRGKVNALEQEFAEYTGAQYCLAVNTGTAALLTALAAVGVGPGDEVIVPGYTFIATISSVVYSRAIPVIAEIDDSLTLDPADVEARITPYTKALLPVHMIGNPCKMAELREIADRHGLIIVEDVAQCNGGRYRGQHLGTIGEMGAFSLNIYKTISAGDGGLVITNDEEFYVRAFGFHDQGHSPGRMGAEVGERPFIGLDFRMNELTGAVALAQLRKLDRILEMTHRNKRMLKQRLQAELPELQFRTVNDEAGETAVVLVVILPTAEAAARLSEKLRQGTVWDTGWHNYNLMENILEKRTITPEGCPFTCPYYKGQMEYRPGMLPQTDDILRRSIALSIGVCDPASVNDPGPNSNEEMIETTAEEFIAAAREVL